MVVLGVGYQLNKIGGELRARAALPVDYKASSCAPGARPPPQVAGATDRGGMYVYTMDGDGWYHGCGYGSWLASFAPGARPPRQVPQSDWGERVSVWGMHGWGRS